MPPRQPRPRGPAYGSKRRPPAGSARRTESIQISRILGELKETVAHTPTEFPPAISAELRAINERNNSGEWNKNDLARLEAIRKMFIRK